jgi:hypothetical protein
MLLFLTAFFGIAIYVLGPLAVRWTYRFKANCHPTEMPLRSLPEPVAGLFRTKIPEIQELGFELTGCFDCGSLATETRSYVAYFCNRRTNDFANVTAMTAPKTLLSYTEFSTRFTNGLVLDTNTNSEIPLTPGNPETRVFRFPEIQHAKTLLQTHRQIVEKYAPNLRAQSESRGAEIVRFIRVVENYGPRHSKIGYMYLADDQEFYRLTWKGAFRMTWNGLFPVKFVRNWLHRHAMNAELHALRTSEVAVLQKV